MPILPTDFHIVGVPRASAFCIFGDFSKEADMLRHFLLTLVVVGEAAGIAAAQGTASPGREAVSAWRQTSDAAARSASPPTARGEDGVAADSYNPLPVRSGALTLPNDGGQVWREYDISPYTARVTTTKRPEQAIIDWVLRETGYEAWHSDPLGVLSANRRTLRVYHTPEMQRIVADLVNRFVSSEAATYTFSLRLITLDSPSWRVPSQRLLRPVPAQTPGVNAWLLAKEDAALLLGELRQRGDYREHSSPYLVVNNGQSTLVSTMRGRPYVRDVVPRPDLPNGFDASPGQVDEGFKLDFSPLLSVDRRMIDATVKFEIDQVEKMVPVLLDVPTSALPRQRTKLDAPQMTHYRFHERFRWPTDQVLLVGMGMVALPVPVDGQPVVPGIPLFGANPARADLLLLVECKGPMNVADNGAVNAPPQRQAKNYRGRY
jgi:hypothetical protein